MDGVLAEVTESYREAIVQTVQTFTGKTVSREKIQEYKNRGGFNNDWLLSQTICADFGVHIEYEAVIEVFDRLFLGDNFNGLIRNESWIPADGLLDRLAASHDLAIFTGRPLADASHTLSKFVPGTTFDPLITLESVEKEKPAPDGLLLIKEKRPGARIVYVGDTVDDARSGKSAGVAFIGVASKNNSRRRELTAAFEKLGAIAVIENVNEIEGVLPR
jgi:HAD superfamily hydrolase (TIGR01548 family)